jgi:hypothetical protein
MVSRKKTKGSRDDCPQKETGIIGKKIGRTKNLNAPSASNARRRLIGMTTGKA